MDRLTFDWTAVICLLSTTRRQSSSFPAVVMSNYFVTEWEMEDSPAQHQADRLILLMKREEEGTTTGCCQAS